MVETHPVYIGSDLKKEIDKESTDMEITMRRLTERALRRGMDEGLHEVPLPREIEDELGKANRKAQTAQTSGDIDRARERLADVRETLDENEFPEDISSLREMADEVGEVIDNVEQDLDEADEVEAE